MNDNYKKLKHNYPHIYKKLINLNIDSSNYEIILTPSNLYTLKIQDEESFYLHSKYNPIREAKNFIDENYKSFTKNYIVYGLGFAYHIKELLERDKDIQINIIETNIDILKIALDNIDLADILDNSRVRLCVSDNLTSFGEFFEKFMDIDDTGLILHTPSIRAIPNNMKEIKYLLEEFKIKEKSIKNTNYDLLGNFKSNIGNYDDIVNNLFNKYKNQPIFLVAAGPSLDKNKHLLKDINDKGIILSVGRAVRVILKEAITPNYIIITDPSGGLYNSQLNGLEVDVPIIVLSTCDKNVMKYYKGKKYIAFQKGFDMAEEYAKSIEVDTIETGGSVATTGLDIAIKMGANPIVFVGQDLAFSEGQTHSKDTYSKKVEQMSTLRKVKDVYGNDVYTSKNLSIYLRWMENRIRQEKDIEFIDATEGGAKIEGTKVMKLKEVLNIITYN